MEKRNFGKERHQCRKNILKLYEEHPIIADSFQVLIWFYWVYVDGLKVTGQFKDGRAFIDLNALRNVTPPCSICRSFRKLCEQKKIPLKPEIAKKRGREEGNYHDYFAQNRGTNP